MVNLGQLAYRDCVDTAPSLAPPTLSSFSVFLSKCFHSEKKRGGLARDWEGALTSCSASISPLFTLLWGVGDWLEASTDTHPMFWEVGE